MELQRKLEEKTQECDRFERVASTLRSENQELAQRPVALQNAQPERASKSSDSLLQQIAQQVSEMKAGPKQHEMKAEHEKQLIMLERRFHRQMSDARKQHEQQLEALRQAYEDDIEDLKGQRAESQLVVKDLEARTRTAEARAEALKAAADIAEDRIRVQREHAVVLSRQSDLMLTFLRQLGPGNMPDLKPELESNTAQVNDLFEVPTGAGREVSREPAREQREEGWGSSFAAGLQQ